MKKTIKQQLYENLQTHIQANYFKTSFSNFLKKQALEKTSENFDKKY